MMTRKEAIKHLRNDWFMSLGGQLCVDEDKKDAFLEAIGMGIKALRPVSREQVEKVWRGCPECKPRCGLCVHMGQWDKYGKPYVCEKCVGFSNFESDQKFCECCGRPLTDEAVEMVMERMDELQNEIG